MDNYHEEQVKWANLAGKSVLELEAGDAFDFFLRSEQYHNFELPEYFRFDWMLEDVRRRVGEKTFPQCLADGVDLDDVAGMNLDILLNKDGQYAVRPILLANPFLYYFLVRELCCEDGWRALKECFETFEVRGIRSCALPVLPKSKEDFHKATTVLNWWRDIEQRSLELSLEYRYMFLTDITNCYGSIDPRTFDWALSRKGTGCETDANHDMAERIRCYLKAFQQGRNIGIPQGSVVFDLLAEIILGYSDLRLHEAIGKAGIQEPYQILRFRDDYRIFCNSKSALEKISYILQQELERLNFRMNSQKTRLSDSPITDSVKSDKLDYIANTPVFRDALKFTYDAKHPIKKALQMDFASYEKMLLYILMFGRKHPNGGQLKVLLSQLDRVLDKYIKERTLILTDGVRITFCRNDDNVEGPQVEEVQELRAERPQESTPIYPIIPGGTVRAMSAIAAQIAVENVLASHYALRVIGRMVETLKNEEERIDILKSVYRKLVNLPNSTYNMLWLQNMTISSEKLKDECTYRDMPLCLLAAGDSSQQIWNLSWLKPSLTDGFSAEVAVNRKRVSEQTSSVITFRENRQYGEPMEETEDEGLDDVLGRY